MDMDAIDTRAAQAFDGFIVRKDLVRRFKNQYPVPTYVVEFLLGRYCASVDEQEIQDGLQIVQRQLVDRAVRAGTEELFKSRAREKGSVKIIDLVSARLDARSDAYLAELPSLRLRDVRIDARLVQEHDRMLTGGFYAEIELAYDATIAQEHSGRPFGIDTLRAIQLSKRNVLDTLTRGRSLFTTEEWKKLLIRSIGLEPEALSPRAQDIVLLRMVPLWNATTTWLNWDHAGQAKATCFNKSRPMHTWYRAARPPSHVCLSTWPQASAGSYASTTWCASTKSPVSPLTRKMASTL
jgi:ATP-dependent Lon protease